MKKLLQKINILICVLFLLGQIDNINAQPNSYYYCGSGFVSSPWTCLGQHPTASDRHELGIVQSIAVHPDNLDIIYAGGGRYGGLWKTTNGGANWVNKTDVLGVASLGISAIAIHPINQNIILAGTITRSYNWTSWDQGIGVIKSIDGGNTWDTTNIATFPVAHKNIKVIRFHPSNPDTVLAAGDTIIYRSTNAGTTWNIVCTIPYERVSASGPAFIDIEFLPKDPTIVLASTDFRGNSKDSAMNHALLYRSDNTGDSWTDKTPSDAFVLGQWGATAISIDVTPADPNNFYLMYQNANTPAKVCIKKSTNGTSWTQIAQFNHSAINYRANWGSPNKFEFEVSNNNLNTFYTGGGTMHRSTDGGNTWTRISEYDPRDLNTVPPHQTHADIRALVQLPSISGDCFFMGDDGGISKTMNGGTTWWTINGNGLVISECYAVGTFKNSNNLVLGLQDNGTAFYNSNTNTWTHKYDGDGGWTEVDYANDNIVYATSNDVIIKSTNGGNSFNTSIFTKGYSTSNWSTWDRFHIDPTDHNKLWFGTRLYSDTTNGDKLMLYNAVSNTCTQKYQFTAKGAKISAIHVAPSNGNIIYVAMENATCDEPLVNKLFKSTNGGTTFTDITSGCTAYNWAYINDFCIDPYNPNSVWAGCGMYWKSDNNPSNSQGTNRVIYSSDGGSTWTDISTGLPPFSVCHLVYREGSDDEIYAGTEGGVYRWNKDIGIWECFNNGFPPAFVTKLEINNCKNTIVASTFGRGVWEAPLPPLSLPVTTYTVSSSQTWDVNFVKSFASNIVIPSGVILTVKGVVKFAENSSITIQPGGKLIIDGGTITNACNGEMWQGIILQGDPNLPTDHRNQSCVEITNGGKIENAITGITVYDGGSVIANTNTQFVNNTVGIKFLPLSTGQTGTSGKFYQTNFVINDNYLGNLANFEAHIVAQSSGKIYVSGASFSSTAPQNNSNKNNGIVAFNSDLSVVAYCLGLMNIYTGCEDPMVKSSFSGLYHAIKASNSGASPTLFVQNSTFAKNIRGITIEGINYSKLTLNNYYITQDPLGGYNTGVYISNATGYKIEENSFFSDRGNANNKTIGLFIRDSGVPENEVYKNTFSTLARAQGFYGINASAPIISPNTGLQTLCNVFGNGQNYDILVGDLAIQPNQIHLIRKNQGSMVTAAGNLFNGRDPLFKSIDNAQSQETLFYHYGNQTNEDPPIITNVTKILATNNNGCPSKIGIFNPYEEEELRRALSQYDEWNGEYEYWLAQLLDTEEGSEEYDMLLDKVSYFSALKDNYFNGIIVAASGSEVRGERYEVSGEEVRGKEVRGERYEVRGEEVRGDEVRGMR